MSTVDKDRKVISRAVRVLDEIESRIHELREELHQQEGSPTGRGRKAKADESAELHDNGHDDAEGHAQGRVKHPESDKRVKGNKAGHEGEADGHADDNEHEPHAQGRVKHPESDKRLKANKPGHDGEADDHPAADDDHEAHAQGRVKHPETDKRVKANKD